MKRAGLDYWFDLRLTWLPDFESLENALAPRRLVLTSVRGTIPYTSFTFRQDDILVFGSESRGLSPDLITAHPAVHIPTWGPVRSLNLSNAVAIVLYEAHRQLGQPAIRRG